MVTQLLTQTYTHKTLEGEFCFWAISAHRARIRENRFERDFFDFFQTICFWKAETELEMDLLEFLGSEVI
jgi:hypothetical protein